MIYRFEALPGDVQKLVRRLAGIQRRQAEVLKAGDSPDERPQMERLFRQEEQAVGDLLSTRFAADELEAFGLEEDCLPEEIRKAGEYFLGMYALERMTAEVNGYACAEDLFYAGALLMQKAQIMEELERETGFDYEETEEFLADLKDDDPERPPLQPDGEEESPKIIPLFGGKKGTNK